MQSSYTISLTNNTVGRWMYENGSIQRSNIRTYGLVLKSAKILIGDLHEQYSLPIILFGVECMKMVAFNAPRSGHRMSCLNELKNFLWSSYTISSTNNTVGRRMYENGSIQCSNIRTFGLVLKAAKKIH